jgi:hypothetical protein|tara:strand:- start:173 stop:481 length:309 start_codon:yes stop_codon:yes gene_type:complete
MIIFTPKTTEAALGTDDSGSSNIGSSEFVRLYNSAAAGTEHLITLNSSDGTDLGTFSLEGLDTVIIRKDATDKLFAANAAVKACGVDIVEVAQPSKYSKSVG